jgi:hypothetical protein
MLKQIIDAIGPIFDALSGAESNLLVTIRQVRTTMDRYA